MRKKYPDDDPQPTTVNITLHEYLMENAPEVMNAEPYMKSIIPSEYFSKMFEAENKAEGKRPGKDGAIVWPYAERIKYLARKFKNADELFFSLIIDARREGIFWRGDDYTMFSKIVTETILYRDLTPLEKAAYKRKTMAVAKSMGERHELF